MKAISLWQPWASMIAAGIKPYETRDWAPPRDLIGQTIAIHAAKKRDPDAAQFIDDLVYGPSRLDKEFGDRLDASWQIDGPMPEGVLGTLGHVAMPLGCVVCTARLDAAFQLGGRAQGTAVPAAHIVKRLTSRQMPSCLTVRIDDWGNYEPGRWAWLLTDIKPLRPPAPVKGAQGFFELPQGWLTGGGV